MSTKSSFSPDEAFERLKDYSHGRMIEPLRAYTLSAAENGVTHLAASDVVSRPRLAGSGKDNFMFTGFQSSLRQSSIEVYGDNNVVFFGPYSEITKSVFRFVGSNNTIYVGAFCTAGDLSITVCGPNGAVSIGDQCMFSNRVIISNSDMHSIYDTSTGMRINENSDVQIDDHVWIGRDVRINKGASVERDCVVGQGSLVTAKIPASSIAVGVPAKVVRTGVSWSRMASASIEEMTMSERHNNYLRKIDRLKKRIETLSAPIGRS